MLNNISSRYFNISGENVPGEVKKGYSLNGTTSHYQSQRLAGKYDGNSRLLPKISFESNDIEKILRESRLINNESNVSAIRSLLKNEVPATRENILRLVDIKTKIDLLVNRMTVDFAGKIAQNGEVAGDVSSLFEAMKKVWQETQEAEKNEGVLSGLSENIEENARPSDSEVAIAVERAAANLFPSGNAGEQERRIIRELILSGVPVTLKNVQEVQNIIDKLSSLKQVSEDAIALVAGQNLPATSRGLLNAQAYRKNNQDTLPQETVDSLEGELRRVIESAGMTPDEKTIKAAKALMRNGIDVTSRTIERYLELESKVENLKDLVNEGTGTELYRRNVSIDNLDPERLLQELKLSFEISRSRGSQAALRYMSMDSNALYDNISLKDLKAMEQQIRSLLAESGIEVTEDTVAAAKALIKNKMEITRENIDKILEAMGRFSEAESLGLITVREGVFFQGKRLTTLEMAEAQSIMRSSKTAADFLYGSGSVQAGQIDALIEQLDGIRVKNYCAVAFLLRNGLNLTLKNANIAFRFIDSNGLKYTDIKLDDQFGMPEGSLKMPLPSGGSERALYDRSFSGYALTGLGLEGIPGEELIDIGGALIQNTLPVDRFHALRLYNAQQLFARTADLALGEGRPVLESLLKRGTDVSTIPLDRLERILRAEASKQPANADSRKQMQQNESNTDSLSVPDNERERAGSIMYQISMLRKINDDYLAIAIKYKIPMTPEKLDYLRRWINNETSLGKELDRLEDWARSLENGDDSGEIRRLINSIRDQLPDSELKNLRTGKDLSEIYNGIKQNLDKLERESIRTGADRPEELFRITGRIRDNLEMLECLARYQTYVQVPLVYREKISNLHVYLNDKKRKNSLSADEGLDVLMNLDTVSLGNLNIRLVIQDKSVKVHFDVEEEQTRRFLSSFSKELSGRMQNSGFSVREISFDLRRKETLSPVESLLSSNGMSGDKVQIGTRAEAAAGRDGVMTSGFEVRI